VSSTAVACIGISCVISFLVLRRKRVSTGTNLISYSFEISSKPEGNRLLGGPRRIWECNIKIIDIGREGHEVA
jgi:hypothetical protein